LCVLVSLLSIFSSPQVPSSTLFPYTTLFRSDEPGEPVRSDWRPTRQRFGALTWRGKDALLRLDFDENGPFLDKFVVEKPARGKEDRKSTRLNSSHVKISYAVFCLKKKRKLIK